MTEISQINEEDIEEMRHEELVEALAEAQTRLADMLKHRKELEHRTGDKDPVRRRQERHMAKLRDMIEAEIDYRSIKRSQKDAVEGVPQPMKINGVKN